MPPRAPPKAYHLLLKTHKLTIVFTVPQSATVATLKAEALSALTSSVLTGAPRIPTTPGDDIDMVDEEESVPLVQSTDDFELCRRDKAKSMYEPLKPSTSIRGLLGNWETLYIQFKDGNGNLLPVDVSQPSLLDEEEEDPRRPPPVPDSPVPAGKGKRKAPLE